MENDDAKLTPRERAYLEHVRRAREQGMTLKTYCETAGLKPRSLYGTRRDMVRKGLLARTRASRASKPDGPGRERFVAVHLAEAPAAEGALVCRVRHPNGWIIECGRWPEAAWMSALLEGGAHAAA